ncbi:hypothetical protein GWE18_33295 [Bradyrhizobium sp. CSA112]|uniref:LysR family transcriptional regulator substrate-binding protein n=1 Tax=Bradyrhizobium sp. sGM-13 TaxID=2831781 RepID=UPI0035C82D0D|nr:hypothetical protein [Bradyrhizobium sp. CSA112]
MACLSTEPHVAMLPRMLSAFRKRYPGVNLHIVEGLTYQTVQARLKDGSIDFYVGNVPKSSWECAMDGPASEIVALS